MFKKLLELWRDEDGGTAIEYSFLVGGVSFAILTGVIVFGEQFSLIMESFSVYLDNVRI